MIRTYLKNCLPGRIHAADAAGPQKAAAPDQFRGLRLKEQAFADSAMNISFAGTRNRAFSMVELSIAIVLFGIVCVTLFSLFSQARTGTIQTRDEINALNCATTLLNFARSLQFDDPFLAPVENKKITTLDNPGSTPAKDLFKVDPNFDCTLSVTPFAPDAVGCPHAYKVLRADVNWSSGGIRRKISMTTLHVGAAK